jgi:hypothetical protein
MAIIQGSKVVFQVLIGDDYKTVVCAKSINLRTQADTKETTTKGDGRFKDFDYDQLTASITLDTILKMQNVANPVHFDFWDYQYQFLEVNFRIIYVDAEDPTKVKVFRGQGIVTDTATNASAAQVVDGTVTILVKSGWFIEDFVPEYSDFRIMTFGNDGAAAQVRVQLLDPATDDVIFDTGLQDEAVNGFLDNPFDHTFNALKGVWYWIIEVRTETATNIWVLSPPPNASGSFNEGIYQFNSKVDGPGNVTRDFAINRELSIQLGAVAPSPDCVAVQLGVHPPMPNGTVGTPYSYSFPITGTAPFTLSDVTKPSWMTISVVPSGAFYTVVFSGTPDVDGTDITVAFNINNCTSGIASFADSIDVAAAVNQATIAWELTVTDPALGTMHIWVNGISIVNVTEPDSGSFNVNENDSVQVKVGSFPTLSFTKHLNVDSDCDGVIHDSTHTTTRDFTFSATANCNYLLTGEVTP